MTIGAAATAFATEVRAIATMALFPAYTHTIAKTSAGND